MAKDFELPTQLTEVVDLAVVGYDETLIRAQHRLAGGVTKINDREAPVTQARRAGTPNAFSIWPTMRKHARHLLCHGRRCRRQVEIEISYNAAHGEITPFALRL